MRFALVNQSGRLQSSDVAAIAEALAIQLRRDVASLWERFPPEVIVTTSPEAAWAGSLGRTLPILLSDSPDTEGALGYHAEDNQGRPYARCFVQPVVDNGGGILDGGTANISFASVVSHEAGEGFIDPDANLWADATVTVGGKAFVSVSYEISDPVQGTLCPYRITDGRTIELSNWVTPLWFDPTAQNGPFDFARTLNAPFQVSPGGYVMGRSGGPGTENAVFAEIPPPAWRIALSERQGSRRSRRIHQKVA